jgi:uncharacterized integral membrane protein
MLSRIGSVGWGGNAVAERREDLRAADVDRQFVADRLKAALDEGRLSLGEYDERLREAYASKTYGDLDKILSDLPGSRPVEHSQMVPAQPLYPTSMAQPPGSGYAPLRSMPGWLAGVWGAWLVAVLVNVVIWLIVSVSTGEVIYFWPIWVAGPWGAVLLAATVTGVLTGAPQREAERRARREEEKQRHREAREQRRRERHGY